MISRAVFIDLSVALTGSERSDLYATGQVDTFVAKITGRSTPAGLAGENWPTPI